MSRHRYSDDAIKKAVMESISIAEVLRKLKIVPAGGNYKTIKAKITSLNLDTSHFKLQGWSKGKKFPPKADISVYLSNQKQISSYKLKLRLIAEGYFEHKCYKCHRILWNDKPIPIELEHIDGNHFNNNLDNLTILCNNCHAQTSTFRGRNKGRVVEWDTQNS